MALELPEVLRLAEQMNNELRGKSISRVHLSTKCKDWIQRGFVNLDQAKIDGLTIESVKSKGIWIFVKLIPDTILLLALGTRGKLLYFPNGMEQKREYLITLDLSDGSALIEDIYEWGWAKAVKEIDVEAQKPPGRLGVSAADKLLTYKTFYDILLGNHTKPILYALLDQQKIAGIGEGYVQDILFKAKIHPAKVVASINLVERINVYHALRVVLHEAIHMGGWANEVDLYNHPGNYIRIMGDHLEDQSCPVCSTRIQKYLVLGVSGFYCPTCQPQ